MDISTSVNGIELNKKTEEDFINIKIPLSSQNKKLVDWFLNELQGVNLKELVSNWFIDEKNCSIISPDKTYILTKRELLFTQLLLKNKIVTYEQMLYYIWDSKSDITQNAIKSFVKNFKKKMPPSLLKNVNGIGYRFIDMHL